MKKSVALFMLGLSLSATLFSALTHADENARWMYIGSKYSGVSQGLEGFIVDAHGDFQGSPKGWKGVDVGNGSTLYSGQVEGLMGNKVEVQQNAVGGTVHVTGIISFVPKDGITGATDQKLGDATKYISVVTYTPGSKIETQTECMNGNCSTVTPAFCNDLLKASKTASFADFQKSMNNCDDVMSSLGKAAQDNKADTVELSKAYKKNMETLTNSKAVANFGHGAKAYVSGYFNGGDVGLTQYNAGALEKNVDQLRLYANSCLAIDAFNNGAAVGAKPSVIPVAPVPPTDTGKAPHSNAGRRGKAPAAVQ